MLLLSTQGNKAKLQSNACVQSLEFTFGAALQIYFPHLEDYTEALLLEMFQLWLKPYLFPRWWRGLPPVGGWSASAVLGWILGILQVAELVPAVPEIIKVGLSELSPQICWIFLLFSLSTWHTAPWKPLTKLGFAPPLHSMLLRCKVSGNITYRFYSQCFQTMEIKFLVWEATESTQLPNNH